MLRLPLFSVDFIDERGEPEQSREGAACKQSYQIVKDEIASQGELSGAWCQGHWRHGEVGSRIRGISRVRQALSVAAG
ncbi:hypothetical protein DPQ22_05160 [Candidatus Tokpelaia sp.]|nr:hypothetical protein DPQ22_05160 [Candidatus Tokpelaia sp.]